MPREDLCYCLRKAGVMEKHVSRIQDMYEGSKLMVECEVGLTKWFYVKVSLC